MVSYDHGLTYVVDGEEAPRFPPEAREEIAKDVSESILIPLKTGTFPH